MHRNGKLATQAKEAESDVLKDVVGYLNGYTGELPFLCKRVLHQEVTHKPLERQLTS